MRDLENKSHVERREKRGKKVPQLFHLVGLKTAAEAAVGFLTP